MNSDTRLPIVLAGVAGLALLVVCSQIPSQRRLQNLEQELIQLRGQLSQLQRDPSLRTTEPLAPAIRPVVSAAVSSPDPGTPQTSIRLSAVTPGEEPTAASELLDHTRRPISVRQSTVSSQRSVAQNAQRLNASAAALAVSTPRLSPDDVHDVQLARATDPSPGYQVLTEDELAEIFAGAGVPPPGPVAATAMPSVSSQESVSRAARPVEKGGVLLPKGKFQIEPSVTYSHVSSNRVALSGFSVFDVIFIGQIRSDEIKRDIISPTLNMRYGVARNLQAELQIPGQYQRQELLSGPIDNRQSSVDSQMGLGDLQGGMFYQFAHENGLWPNMIANVRLKAPTGAFPKFGSGAWGLRSGLLLVKSSDPVALFTNLGYVLNFPTHLNGLSINPGNSFEYSAGIAYALNYNLSFNGSFEQIFIGESETNGTRVKGSRLVVANLKAGLTYAITRQLAVDFTVGSGLTEDSPDLTVSVSVPYTF